MTILELLNSNPKNWFIFKWQYKLCPAIQHLVKGTIIWKLFEGEGKFRGMGSGCKILYTPINCPNKQVMEYICPVLWTQSRDNLLLRFFRFGSGLGPTHPHTPHDHSLTWKILIKDYPLTLFHNSGLVYSITCFHGQFIGM